MYRIFEEWLIFMETVLLYLNLKPNDRFLPFSMSEIFFFFSQILSITALNFSQINIATII